MVLSTCSELLPEKRLRQVVSRSALHEIPIVTLTRAIAQNRPLHIGKNRSKSKS